MNRYTVVEKQRLFYKLGKTRNVDFRLRQLIKLKKWIKQHNDLIMVALQEDLGKAPFEAYITEIGFILEELNHSIKHLKEWDKEFKVKSTITQFPSKSFIYKEPYGVVLIMAPWNYPFQLTMAPLIGAIASGNCVVLKPSEFAPATSSIIKKMIREIFPPYYIDVVEGGIKENEALLEHKFDYIFFTGSSTVGKIVMRAASNYLTPVCLELGGKSPCIVDETANIKLAAKRIVWGKFLNAGQTCVAPDYVYVQESIKEKFLNELVNAITSFYGNSPCTKEDYPRIINKKHFDRLSKLIESDKVFYGGKQDANNLKIEPTILTNVSWETTVMQDEIFGPILPVLTFSSFGEITEQIMNRPKPLALYLFTTSRKREDFILKNISFGGGCINDTIVHLCNPNLPFGGVGESGIGFYHGKYSYDTFTHYKSVLKKGNWLDIPLRYPPYKNHLSLAKRIFN